MKRIGLLKKVFASLFVLVLLFTNVIVAQAEIDPEHVIIGNNTPDTAYNIGHWEYKDIKTCGIDEKKEEAWFKFSMSPDQQIYVACSGINAYNGIIFTLYDANTMEKVMSVSQIADPSSFIKFLAVKADGFRSTSYFLKVERGNYVGDILFSLKFADRMKDATKTFKFPGTAQNKGNVDISLSGVDSSVITVDLSGESSIPNDAVVKRVETSSSMYPSQGNVRHMLMPKTTSTWYESRFYSAESGYYYIDSSYKIPVKQIWSFKYNAKASAKSTMSNVTLRVSYIYDMTYGWNFR